MNDICCRNTNLDSTTKSYYFTIKKICCKLRKWPISVKCFTYRFENVALLGNAIHVHMYISEPYAYFLLDP
jgi:hypothetical protein